MAFGLTEDGFIIKRLSDIITGLEEKLVATLGNINTDPDSVFGQIIGTIAEAISEPWAETEEVYLAYFPASAVGFSLDNAVQYNSITRLDATSSTVPVLLIGDEGSVIPGTTTEVSRDETGEIYAQDVTITISKSNVVRTTISVDTEDDTHLYTLTIEGESYSYQAVGGDTATEIIAGLVADIIANQPSNVEQVTPTDNGDDTMTILVNDDRTNVAVTFDSFLTLDEIATSVLYRAANTGVLSAPIGTINTIETPVAGLSSVENIVAATPGTTLESDVELRARRLISIAGQGNASIPAIRTKLLDDVDGVISVTVIENDDKDPLPSGQPGKSIQAVVVGGEEQDVADKIWETKAGGIETFGNTSVEVFDAEGNGHFIDFTRPTDVYGWVNVVLTLVDDGTEEFPNDGIQAVKDAILAFGQSYLIGEDILIQRFFTPIFSVNGIKSAVVTVKETATTTPPSLPYGSVDIAIETDEIVRWDDDPDAQILVSVAP